jgi:hypothetical protein
MTVAIAIRRRPFPGVPFLRMLLGSLLLVAGVAAQETTPTEQQVKAAFLVNFPKYVEWPAACFAQSNSPIVLAVFGDAGLAEELARIIAGKHVNHHPLSVVSVALKAELGDRCHVVYVGDSAQHLLPEILETVKGASVLTVGADERFIERGGMINLARKERKVRLEVNLPAAKAAGLTISSRLLAIADSVKK